MADNRDTLPGILDNLPAVNLAAVPDTAEALPRNPEFTAARLFSQKPETAKLIISMLLESVPLLAIARVAGVSINTVSAVRDRFPEVDTGRAKMGEACKLAARITAESILEDLADDTRRNKIPFKDKAIALGVLVDKGELLTGGATSRLAHEYIVQIPEGAEIEAFNGLLSAGSGRVIDISDDTPPAIGCGAENSGQKGAPGANGAGLAGDGVPAAPGDRQGDAKTPPPVVVPDQISANNSGSFCNRLEIKELGRISG